MDSDHLISLGEITRGTEKHTEYVSRKWFQVQVIVLEGLTFFNPWVSHLAFLYLQDGLMIPPKVGFRVA